MRLLFAYVEFLNRDGTKRLHHGFSQLSLNFSTDQRFSYCDGVLSVAPLENPIPSGFFGKRIYNITTLVGDNGVGKTTILHYLIDLLQQLYVGRYYGHDRGLLVIEDQERKYALEYHGEYGLKLDHIPDGIERIPFRGEKSAPLSATKLIYLANTLTRSDFELVRGQPAKADDQYVNRPHFRHEFLYNCSTASLMIENCQNDCRKALGSAAEYLNCFFFYEQYKQVKYVFDQGQYAILKKLRDEGYPVPVPQKLTIELLRADRDAATGDSSKCSGEENICVDTMEDQYDWMLYELCLGCLDGFLQSVWLRLEMAHYFRRESVRSKVKWMEFYKGNQSDRKALLYDALAYIYELRPSFLEKENELFITDLYKNCAAFLGFVVDEMEHLRQHFEMDPRYGKAEERESQTILFSIKTTGEAAEWFMTFLQKYRYTCEPYYYLQFHWGLSSGEQNLLRLFSSLYYIFDADFNNPERGGYKIYTVNQGRKVPCDSVMLWLDEADLTYHPEWQRCFLAILTAFLPKIYPGTCCQEIQIFLTTHSPLMLGDSPAQSVIYLSRDPDGNVIIDDSGSRQTFGENLYTLLQRSFRVQNSAVGELVQLKIQGILDTLRAVDNELNESKEEKLPPEKARQYQAQLQGYKEKTVSFLADGIIKAKLETEINRCLWRLKVMISGGEDTQLRDVPLTALMEELRRREERFQ